MSTTRMIFEQKNVQHKIYQRLHSDNFNDNFNRIIITVNLFCALLQEFQDFMGTITGLIPSNRVQNLLRESDIVL